MFLYAKRLIDEAIKFRLVRLESSNWLSLRRFVSPWVFSSHSVFTFSNTLMKVSGCVGNII